MDLTKKVAEYVNFDYKITLVKDNAYGKKFKNGTWNGMVGEVVRGVSFKVKMTCNVIGYGDVALVFKTNHVILLCETKK